MEAVPTVHHLEVIEGPDAGSRFELPPGEPQLIGRSSEALAFSDKSISRRHAELTPGGGEWWLRDLRSRNGTFVNGAPVLDVVRLRDGDRVRCGDTVMRVTADTGGSRLDGASAGARAPGAARPGRGAESSISPDAPDALRLAAIGETIATLSHSIKNIMQGLRGGADAVELALQQGNLDRAREGWPILARNLDRVLALTLNMLAYAKDRPLDVDLEDPNATIREVAELLAAACRRKRIRLELDLDPDLPPIPMDAAAIHQAVVNLATNAIEAAPDRTGVVAIRTRFVLASTGSTGSGGSAGPVGITGSSGSSGSSGSADSSAPIKATGSTDSADPSGSSARPARCEIVVEDNGPGISPAQRPHLFEPFSSTKGQRGTGLGLAVTRKIAIQHGGDVSHEERSGGGTRMLLNLPAHSDDFDAERTRTPTPLPDGDVGIAFEE